MNIREKVEELNSIIHDARMMIKAVQEECEHPLYTAKYGGNTGNWSSSDDSYWVDFHCPDCEWTMRAYSDCEETGMYYRGRHERVIR